MVITRDEFRGLETISRHRGFLPPCAMQKEIHDMGRMDQLNGQVHYDTYKSVSYWAKTLDGMLLVIGYPLLENEFITIL